MQKIILKIYIKKKIRPLCTVELVDVSLLENFISDLDKKSIIKFGQVVLKSEEFRYATINYK